MNVKENNLEEKCNFVLGKAEDKVNDICQAATEVRSCKNCVWADPKISYAKISNLKREFLDPESLIDF